MKTKKLITLTLILVTLGMISTTIFDIRLDGIQIVEAKKVKIKDHQRRYDYLIGLGITESFIKQYTTKRLTKADVDNIVRLWDSEESNSNVKVYDFTLTCNSSNPEAEADKIIPDDSDPGESILYKKFAFSEIKLASMPNMQLYEKSAIYLGTNEESWSKTDPIFYTEGYLWLYYGSKEDSLGDNGRCLVNLPTNYRLFIYE